MIRVLALLSFLACSDSPSADSPSTHSPATTSQLEESVDFEDRLELAERIHETDEAREVERDPSDEAEAPPGFNRAILGAYISIGDPAAAFSPGQVSYLRGGESPFLLVTPNITEQMPRGYQVEMQLPSAAPEGPVAAEALHVKVNNEAGETFDVRGEVTFRSLDLSSGHIALVVDGETNGDTPLTVEVEVDARFRVVQD